MLLYAGLSAGKNILRPDLGFDDPRGAVAAIVKDWQAGDCIYASRAAMPVIVYYGPVLGDGKNLEFVSSRKPAYTVDEAEQIVPLPRRIGRLWFLYLEPNESGFDRRMLEYFKQHGSLVSEAHYKHYTVALWNLQTSSKGKS